MNRAAALLKNKKAWPWLALGVWTLAIGVVPGVFVLALGGDENVASSLRACQNKIDDLQDLRADDAATGQDGNAKAVVDAGQSAGASAKAVLVALSAALAESGLSADANPAVPESMSLPHGSVDHDHRGIGIYHLSPERTGLDPASLLDPAESAAWFYRKLRETPDWESLDLAQACQAVLQSPFPEQCAAQAPWAAYHYDHHQSKTQNGPKASQAIASALKPCEAREKPSPSPTGTQSPTQADSAAEAARAFAADFTDPAGGQNAWLGRLTPNAAPALVDQLRETDPARVYTAQPTASTAPEAKPDGSFAVRVTYDNGMVVALRVQRAGKAGAWAVVEAARAQPPTKSVAADSATSVEPSEPK
jgi:hypothetical protein